MPQSTPERRARWGIDDAPVRKFLHDRGYRQRRDWSWDLPTPDHKPTEEEIDAVIFLIEEWDMDGINYPKENQ